MPIYIKKCLTNKNFSEEKLEENKGPKFDLIYHLYTKPLTFMFYKNILLNVSCKYPKFLVFIFYKRKERVNLISMQYTHVRNSLVLSICK